jgi:hypothetical protein
VLPEDFIGFSNHIALLLKIDRLEKKKPVRYRFGIAVRDLPEPLNREPLGIDEYHRTPGSQAGNGGDHAQRTLTACRTSKNLGDSAQFKSSAQ